MNTYKIENRTNAYNNMAKVMNEVCPQIVERLKNGYKLKADGSFFKKDQEDLSKLLDLFRETGLRAYFDNSGSSVSLMVDVRYPDSKPDKFGHQSNSYIKEYVYLINHSGEVMDYDEREIISLDKVVSAVKAVSEMREQISELESQCSMLRRQYLLDQ